MTSRYSSLMVFLVAFCLSGAFAQPSEKEQVLFTVGGKPITSGEVTYLFKKNHPKPEDHTETKVTEYINLLTTFKVKVAEANARRYDTTRAFQKEFASYRTELRKPYLADNDQLTLLTKQAYERMQVEVRASHILVNVPPSAIPADTLAAYAKIMALRDRVMKGEDFNTLARTISDDPTARSNGGDLGYFTVMQMVYAFEDVVYRLKTGEVSMPVRTQFGYHIIRVADRRMARGEVEVSHIILRAASKEDSKVKTKIFEIHSELEAGRSWDELCKEFSDDAATKNTGGRLRPFGVGVLATVPEFEQMAFTLHNPGEISDPFQSQYGWHIIRLERRIPVPPFEKVQESLRKRVSRDERLKLADERIRAGQLKRHGYSESSDVKNQVLQLADSNLSKGRWRFKGPADLQNKSIFVLKGKSYTAGDFVRYVEREQSPRAMTYTDYMAILFKEYVSSKLDDVEDEELMQLHPEYRNLINEYREGMLLFTIMEKEVWNKATEDSVGLRTFYDRNASRYTAGERVRARVFTSDDSVFVNAVMMKIQKGDSVTRAELKRFKSALGPRNFVPGESKAVDRAPQVVGVYKVRVEATHAIVQILQRVPAGIRSLDEIRSQVISDYQDYLEKEWVKGLKAKYPVKFNSKARKSVIRELTQP